MCQSDDFTSYGFALEKLESNQLVFSQDQPGFYEDEGLFKSYQTNQSKQIPRSEDTDPRNFTEKEKRAIKEDFVLFCGLIIRFAEASNSIYDEISAEIEPLLRHYLCFEAD